MNVGVIGSVSKKHIYFFYIRISHIRTHTHKAYPYIYMGHVYVLPHTGYVYTHAQSRMHGHVYSLLSSPYIYNIWKEMKKYFII